MEFERTKQIQMHFDIAPLIDIVFLLLIFFMLSANFIMQPGIKITLPAAKMAKLQDGKTITVFISGENKIYLNDKQINIDELKGALEERLEYARKKTVILKADGNINLSLAVKVMDIAKQANAEGLVISTQIKDKLFDESPRDKNVVSAPSVTESNPVRNSNF